MNNSKAEALLTAARTGKVARIRELLAAGAPIEARDVNRKTPVMVAAHDGHAEAFRMLVEAGADLHALADRQVDVLEMAARSGNVEIVKLLLDRGLPVNGHWQPKTVDQLADVPEPARVAATLRKMGHATPLIEAATNGRVEAVRVLLEAGADRNATHQGKTALQLVQEQLRDPDYADEKQTYREIAALLGDQPAKSSRSADLEVREVAKFATNARRPAYVEFLRLLVERCGEARPWHPMPDHGRPAAGVHSFTFRGCKRQKTLKDLHEQARQAGCHLVLGEPWAPGEDAQLVLFPTANKLAVVVAVGTEGANYNVKTSDVTAWLDNLDQENPFHLVLCSHELVGGAFRGPVKGAGELAERMAEICPCCLDDGPESPVDLARMLKKQKSFLLRWD